MKLSQLFSERVISYYPQLRKITGSIDSALLLQQLLYWWDKKIGDSVYKTISDIDDEIGLSRKEQDNAIGKLKSIGFLSVELRGVPARRHFVLDIEIIEETLQNKLSSLYKRDKLDCPETTNQFVQKGQSTIQETTTKNTALELVRESFQKFWEIYPNKKGKPKAFVSWKRINPSQELCDKIMAGVEKYKRSEQWRETRYIPHPTTFLNQERWDDEIEEVAQQDKVLSFNDKK